MEKTFQPINIQSLKPLKNVYSFIVKGPEIYKCGCISVYIAEDKNTHEIIAVKSYNSELMLKNDDYVRSEHERLKTLSDLGIFPTLKGIYVKSKSSIYVPQCFCNCGSLDSYINNGPLPIDTIRDILKFLAGSLQIMHEKGIIHRDINPSHVLINMDEKKNISFKLIGHKSINVFKDGRIAPFVCTLAYRSPETAQDNKYSFSTDIWSLGISLYEMATGCLPTNYDPNFVAMIKAGSNLAFPPGVKINDTLADLITRCLCYQPEKRLTAKQILEHPFTKGSLTMLGGITVQSNSFDIISEFPPKAPVEEQKTIILSDPECMHLIRTDLAKYIEYSIKLRGKPSKLKVEKKVSLEPYIMKDPKPFSRGGFSEVYLCTHNFTKKDYVMKKVFTDKMDSKKTADLLIGEVEIMLELKKSAFSIGIKDQFVYENNLCIIIDYCNGGDLEIFIRSKKKKNLSLLPEEYRLIAWNIGCGLRDMHARGIIHRDIKPKNVLVIKDEDDKMVDIKLCDYGLSKNLEEQKATHAMTLLGTEAYMAPELLESLNQFYEGGQRKAYDRKVDVWSYGVVLYFAIYGITPMDTKISQNKVLKEKSIPFPSKPAAPVELINLVKRCLEFDPKKRPDFQELLQDPYYLTVDYVKKDKLLPYVQGKLIGESNASKIYEGMNGKKACVFKTIPFKETLDNRTKAEIYTLCNLRGSANIVKLLDYFIFNNLVYLVMNSYSGGDLEKYVWNFEKKHETIPLNQKIFIAFSVLNGINEIHKRQMIHRDIHPKNILLRSDLNNLVKDVAISDFGFAKVLLEGMQAVTQIGSYKSPELVLYKYDKAHDGKTDIWSYGMLIYFLLFGLHADQYKENTQQKIYKGDIKYDTKRQNVSPELLALMKACLIVEPKDRPSSAELLNNQIFKPFINQ